MDNPDRGSTAPAPAYDAVAKLLTFRPHCRYQRPHAKNAQVLARRDRPLIKRTSNISTPSAWLHLSTLPYAEAADSEPTSGYP